MNTALRPRVSVVITTRNNGASLRYAVESVIWQTFVNFEVWVIGANCTDHSEDVVQSFCDPRLFWFNAPATEFDFGLTIEALKRSRGEYIAYLSDDDIWLPNHLEALVESMMTTDADVVCSMTQCIQEEFSSVVCIPMLPDLTHLPHRSSVLNKRNCVVILMPGENPQFDYNSFLFYRGRKENLQMEVVPITTGLRFLCGKGGCPPPQSIYMERLRNDSNFINKELSSILLNKERSTRMFRKENLWMSSVSRPLFRLVNFFLFKIGYPQELKGLKRQPNFSLVAKNVKAA